MYEGREDFLCTFTPTRINSQVFIYPDCDPMFVCVLCIWVICTMYLCYCNQHEAVLVFNVLHMFPIGVTC